MQQESMSGNTRNNEIKPAQSYHIRIRKEETGRRENTLLSWSEATDSSHLGSFRPKSHKKWKNQMLNNYKPIAPIALVHYWQNSCISLTIISHHGLPSRLPLLFHFVCMAIRWRISTIFFWDKLNIEMCWNAALTLRTTFVGDDRQHLYQSERMLHIAIRRKHVRLISRQDRWLQGRPFLLLWDEVGHLSVR